MGVGVTLDCSWVGGGKAFFPVEEGLSEDLTLGKMLGQISLCGKWGGGELCV